MNWFLIALIGPLFYALVNHFDKYLISRWLKDSPVGVLVLFSSLTAIFVLPVLLFIEPGLFKLATLEAGLMLTFNGALYGMAILLYLHALENDEASYVAPLFQLSPVAGLILGYLILGETLNSREILAAFMVVIGSVILSLEFADDRRKIKFRMVTLMMGSVLLFTMNNIIFKYYTPDNRFITSLFWNMAGMVFFGLILLIIQPTYRKQFIHLLKSHHYNIVGMNVLNELLNFVAEIATLFALMLAPVVLVQTVGSLQPLAVFVIGVIITLFFPKFGRESLLFKHLTQKILAISIICVGIYYMAIA